MRREILLGGRFPIANGMARRKTPSDTRIGPKSNILTASRSDIAITNQGDLAPAGIDSAHRQSTILLRVACAMMNIHGRSPAAAKSRGLPRDRLARIEGQNENRT